MYDYSATECFRYLEKNAPDIIRILDMASIPAGSINEIILQEEKDGYGQLYLKKRMRYSRKYCEYFGEEIRLADFYLCASGL
jgi:hypothetical protein